MKKGILIIIILMLILSIFTSSVNSEILIKNNIQYDTFYDKYIVNNYQNDIINMIEQLNLSIVYNYIENLTSFGLRETGTSSCVEVAKYIYNEFQNMGLEVRYQNWTDNDIHGSNVEATLNGIDNSSDEIYILCAHYDTYPGSPGADDNAAGVAAILSAAKIMSQHNFINTVKFVSFSGEEQGWIGSSYYSEECLINNDNIIAVLDPDATGYSITEEGFGKVNIFDYEESEWITDFISYVAERYIEYINLEVVHGGHQWHSAHTSFYQRDYNAVAFFEYDVNPYLHSGGDTFENMNPEYAMKVSKLCMSTLIELSELYVNGSVNKPRTPNGPSSGSSGESYSYCSSAVDDDGYDLFYMFDWGDGSKSPWIGPILSGQDVVAEHIWNDKGNYEIKVKAKNELGSMSEWSDPLPVSMPRFKLIDFFNPWLFRLIQHLPILEFFYLYNFNIMSFIYISKL